MIGDELSVLARGFGQAEAPHEFARMVASLVSAAHEFIGIADLSGRALYVNEAGRRLIGLRDLDAVQATEVIDYFAPKDQSKIINDVFPAVRASGYWEGELNFRNFETGESIPVLYNIFPIRDASGAIAAYGTVTRNLSETKLAEQRLRYVASIVESSDDAIVSKNLDGIITSWNRGAERIFGFSAAEAIANSILIVVPEDRKEEEVHIIERIRKGDHVDHFETVRQRKDGTRIIVSLTVSPVKNAEGAVIGASKIARDITERRQDQERISALAKEAEHRSKNLLQTVQAVVRLSKSTTPEGLKLAIEGRLHALANVHSLFVETRWVGADLSTIANQELAPYSDERSSRVRVSGPDILLRPDDAQAVAMILHELATNAAKYGALSKSDGRVTLSWEQTQDGNLDIAWTESEGPPIAAPSHQGFGSRIVEQMVRKLKGGCTFDWQSKGLICKIRFPL